MQKTTLKSLFTGILALCLALGSTAFGQGVTSAAMNGFVTDKNGAGVGNATVTVIHVSSGTRNTVNTRQNGQFDVTGLRPGGPYTVTVTAAGFQPQSQKDINIALAESATVSFTMSSDVVVMEAFSVAETKDTTFGAGKMGTGTMYDSQAITLTPSVRQDPQELANNDPRFQLTLNTSTGEFQLSAQGQNFRYNSFLIDGVQANDTFGLNGNGTDAWISLIPFDAMAGFNIDLVPYDIERTGFTGALLTTIVKSGTNDFHGSVRYTYSDQDYRAKNPVTNLREPYKQHDIQATFGGPIIKDKLFFFVAYEDFKKTITPPNVNFVPSAADLAKIIAAAKSYGYDAGTYNPTSEIYGKTFVGKLDWNISDRHRASLTYRRNDSSSPAFAGVSGATFTSLSNYWYQQKRLQASWQTQVESNWTPDLHTEFTASYTKTDNSPINNGTPFPEIIVNGVTGTRLDTGATTTTGGIDLGTEFSRQLNKIFFKDYVGKLYADYTWGNHKFKFGGDSDKTQYTNLFAQALNGSYTFNTITGGLSGPDAFAAGAPVVGYTLASVVPGYTIDQAFSRFSITDYGLAVQDTWRPNSAFMTTFGVRYDQFYTPGHPAANAAFQSAFGFPSNTTASGRYTFGPRLGFNYDLPTKSEGILKTLFGGRRTQLRGGLGLFQGSNPAVWISNAFSNTGALSRTGVSNAAGLPGLTFNPNPTTQQVPAGTASVPVINVTDPNFTPPNSWKGNLALDHKLPWGDLTVTLETGFSWVRKAGFVQSLNIQTAAATGGTATMPDGRIHYAGTVTPGITGTPATTSTVATALLAHTNIGPTYIITNTDKGDAEDYTLRIARPMKNHWSFSAAYTRSSAREVSPFTSSVAQSNFNGRAYYNPNENVASTTNYVTPDKFVVQLARQFNFFKDTANTKTTVSLAFRAQSGHPFSWVFRGDANGDGFSGNDLFYVPTGPNDPKVTWASATEQAAFFNFVDGTDLKNYAGKVVQRNSTFGPWQRTVDLHIGQELPLYHGLKMELFADCSNFANLFNKKWGVVEGMDFPYERRVAGTTYNAATGQYAYVFNSNTLDPITTFTDLSRWQVVFGARVSF